MAYDDIHKEARRILRMCETRDPFRIARELGIHVMFNEEFIELKGMYAIIKRSRFIFLNAFLDEHESKTVCAHEIGHDRFHRHLAQSSALQEYALYGTRGRQEIEANVFASDILIDDNEILELVGYDYSLDTLAGELGVDTNLVLIKLDALQRQGYEVRAPYIPRSDFMGR